MPSSNSDPGDPPFATGDPFTGTPYKEVERLGSGGMGDVHVVEHRGLRRKFVAKILRAEFARHPQVMDRMRLEGQALGQLSHPHIVTITGFERTADGRPFLVMEYLRGQTLTAELRERGLLSVGDAVTYTSQLLSALSAAHGIGVVHRDIKPDNLFLSQAPSAPTVLKVLDFGIARVLPSAPPNAPLPLSVPTTTGTVVGTPRFVSPEAAAGERVNERADLYSAALMLYTMLAGRGPFDHVEGEQNLLSAHALETPAPPSAYAKEPVPSELDEIVLKALAKDPSARFQTAKAFRERLEGVAGLLARPTGWLETTAFNRESGSNMARGPSSPISTSGGRDDARRETREVVAKQEGTQGALGFPKPVLLLAFVLALLLTGLAVVAVVVTLRGAR